MKIKQIATIIDGITVDELYELIELGFVDSFTTREDLVIDKNGYTRGLNRECKHLDPEAGETEGLDWYVSLSKTEKRKLKKTYKELMENKK